jgi:hypothetical protein
VFKEEDHSYWNGGVKYPSVTQIISDMGLYGDTSYFTDYSRDRGLFVHKIIQWHLSGELDESSIDSVLQPYFDAWLRFEKEAAYVSEVCEKVMASDMLHFAGTADHIGHLNGHYCIADVKTGAPSPAHAIQTAAYAILLKHPGVKRFSLYLTDKGNYKLIENKDRQDEQIFKSALALYFWKQNNLKKG